MLFVDMTLMEVDPEDERTVTWCVEIGHCSYTIARLSVDWHGSVWMYCAYSGPSESHRSSRMKCTIRRICNHLSFSKNRNHGRPRSGNEDAQTPCRGCDHHLCSREKVNCIHSIEAINWKSQELPCGACREPCEDRAIPCREIVWIPGRFPASTPAYSPMSTCSGWRLMYVMLASLIRYYVVSYFSSAESRSAGSKCMILGSFFDSRLRYCFWFRAVNMRKPWKLQDLTRWILSFIHHCPNPALAKHVHLKSSLLTSSHGRSFTLVSGHCRWARASTVPYFH